MTTTELHNVEALLERALPDPLGFMDRVLQQLVDRLATESPAGPHPSVIASYDAAAHQQLEDHNVVLAAALGACECWGHDPDCANCSGAGSAGWMDPDAQLYDEYAIPAVRRMADPAVADGGAHEPTEDLQEGERT